MQTTRSTFRILGAGAAAAALAGCLSACGGAGSGASGSPSAPDSPSYSAGASLTPAQVEALAQRAMSATTSAHVRMTMSLASTGSIQASGVVRMKPLAEDLTMQLMGRKMEVRMVGQAMYLHMAGLPKGVVWIKIDSSAFGKLGLGGLTSGISNPLGMIDGITKSIKSATYVDREKLDGVEVDHYRIVVDGQKALKSVMPSAAPSTGTSKLPATIAEDLFVGPDGRIAEAKVEEGAQEAVDVQMSDYNQKVDVQQPPAGQTKDLTDMMSQMGGSLGGGL